MRFFTPLADLTLMFMKDGLIFPQRFHAFCGFDTHDQNQVHNNICIDMCEGLACVLGDLSFWVQILI